MFELMFTSFPAVIRYLQLRRRGEAMTVWNMKTAVFLWAVLAFALFTTIFYFHPKTYAGILPFRTVSVVPQTTGPITEIAVVNGQHVSAGDLLFRIEDSAQKAALDEARAQLALIDAAEAKAVDAELVAQSAVDEAVAQLKRLNDDLSDAQTLVDRGVGRADAVLEAEASIEATEAQKRAAEAQLDLARIDLEDNIPAQRKAAEASIEKAEVAYAFTEVRSFTDGMVTQLALSLGSPASTLVLRPAMVIIPDRPEDEPIKISAGFSQISRTTLYEGMPAEIACESNANLLFKNSVMPARVVSVQPAVSTGQVIPDGELKDLRPASERGAVHAFLELEYKEHEEMLLDGTGCIVQAYTRNIEGIAGHLVSGFGVVKAVGLRIKVLGSILSGVGLLGGGGH